MNEDTSLESILAYYEEAIKELAKTEPSKYAANEIVKKLVRAKFPDFFTSWHPTKMGSYAQRCQMIQIKYYPKEKKQAGLSKVIKPEPFRFEVKQPLVKKTFMDKIRDAAKTGFIPFAEYLNPFVPIERDSLAAYISHLRSEGYTAERNGKGWIITPPEPKETAEEKAAREAKEQREKEIKALKDQMATLLAKLDDLSNDLSK